MSEPQRPEPRTEAGRILLAEHSSGTPHMARHILAIEAEARAAERTETSGLREALLRILDLANLPLDEMRQRHGSEQRVLMAVIPSIVDAALTADPRPPATGPVPTPEAPTAATGPRDWSELAR